MATKDIIRLSKRGAKMNSSAKPPTVAGCATQRRSRCVSARTCAAASKDAHAHRGVAQHELKVVHVLHGHAQLGGNEAEERWVVVLSDGACAHCPCVTLRTRAC